jgi:TolB-like protein/predicted Ser/Thr protein kinase
MENDAVLRELARAALDGTPADWASAESSAVDESMRRLVRDLKLIAEIAEVHNAVSASIDREANTDAESPATVTMGDEPLAQALQTWSVLSLLEKIGEGGFGEVYRAWDTRLDREVALKLLRGQDSRHARARSAVIEEGRMLAQVRHPNVVTVHGADRSAGRVGLWMEFIHGRTLEQVLSEQGPFGAVEATSIGIDLCVALSAVHRAGLLHRDIKARNVMRDDGGRIVLMDFGTGLDQMDGAAGEASRLAGTPLYMAPEMLEGRAASVRSDIYSVGVLLYRLVTGSYPVQGRGVAEVRDAHARGARTFLRDARPDLPEPFVRIVERALSPQAEGRYASAGAMEAALATAAQDRTSWSWRKLAIAASLLVLVGTGSLWLAAGTSQPPVIAVLPFRNLSVEPDSEYFVDGLTDEVIRNLSMLDGLTVTSSYSSFTFKNKPHDMSEVVRQLNADYVLDASVLRAGTQLRINPQLVRAADGVPIWSERYDKELKDIFAIQDEISREIVNKLRLTLGRGQRRYYNSVEAYELYLRGLALARRGGVPNLPKAAECFEQALAKDPTFAPAHAGLANVYALMLVLPFNEIPFETAQPMIRAAAVKALELDPLLADAEAAMGLVHSGEFDWSAAENAFQRALELNPSLTPIYTIYTLSTLRPLGKHDEALRLLRAALEYDPLSLDLQREIGIVQQEAGRYEEAIDTLQRIRKVDPDFPFVDEFLGRALTLAGRPADALPVFERSDQLMGRPRRNPGLALAYVLSGSRAEAEALAAEHEDGNHYARAMIYAALGDTQHAFEALDRLAVLEPHRVPRLLVKPEMAGLRGDPRLTALRKRFNLP